MSILLLFYFLWLTYMPLIFSEKFGKVLVLDDIIQCTEKDEFVYHEMMAHIPLYSHPCPKSVS